MNTGLTKSENPCMSVKDNWLYAAMNTYKKVNWEQFLLLYNFQTSLFEIDYSKLNWNV